MKRPLVALVAIALFATPLSAMAAVKAGDSCKKAGITATANGKKFTCVKSGKKLIWNKGVAVAIPKPAVTPTPTATPTAKLTRYQAKGCHAQVSASLQVRIEGIWKDLKEAEGWAPVSTCPSTNPVQPYVNVYMESGTSYRWHIYAPGRWDFYSEIGVVKATLTPKPTPTSTKIYNSLWEKYDLTKPTSADEVIKKATDNFKSYTSVIRNPDQEVKFYAQPGVDETLINWVKEGSLYVARRFEYPALPPTFSSIIAIDKTWLEATYLAAGFPANKAKGQAEGFCGEAPACGSADSNLWNYSVIQKSNSLVNNKVGLAQTPGHEFFHAIHGILAKDARADVAGTNIPNWYIEGPAMFVGLQTSGVLGFADYSTLGRPSMTDRFKYGKGTNLTSTLSEFKANDGVVDPYAIGFAATEFLVSQVGIEKMIGVYEALGEDMSFEEAFQQGTGIELVDFYSMFEEIREIIGFAKG